MSTYQELKQQAEQLLAQAEDARKQEIAGAIEEIRSKMQEYGIKPEDFGVKAAAPDKRRPAAIKYRDSAGNTWTGRGRAPRWMQAHIAAGGKAEEFAVQ